MLSRLWKTPPWKNSDWRVREQAVSQITDREVLLDLAAHDEAVEVRLAVIRALPDDTLRLQIIRENRCDRSRQLAITLLKDAASKRDCVFNRRLPPALRQLAVKQLPLAHDDWLRLAAADENEELRTFALGAMPPEAPVDSLWDGKLPIAFKLSLLPRLADQKLIRSIYEKDTEREARIAAASRITDPKTVAQLFAGEEDVDLRQALITRVNDEPTLFEMMDEEREPRVRAAIVQRMSSAGALDRVARGDQDPQVRSAAAQRSESGDTLLAVATNDADRRVRLVALHRMSDEKLRAQVARTSRDEQIRAAAIHTITSPDILATLRGDDVPVDVRWAAGRRLGLVPIDALAAIRSEWILAQTAAHDGDQAVREMAIRLVRQRETLEALSRSLTGPAQELARTRLREVAGHAGMRFVPVPGRPYAVSTFPVTRGQVRAISGATTRWPDGGDDLPATGMTPKEISTFCSALSQIDRVSYRLPSFEEWRHFVGAEHANWFREIQFGGADVDTVARVALHTGASGVRATEAAWPNPWGVLDAIGNVAVWVEDQIGDASWVRFLQRDPLAENPAGAGAESRAEDFALAAGFCWSDKAVRMDRSDRLVRLDALEKGAARDRVGFRLLRPSGEGVGHDKPFKLIFQPEPRWGLAREVVNEAVAQTKLFTQSQMEQFWRVAPVMLQSSHNYESLRPMKRRLELCGVHVAVTA